jgi:hypothetical protein
MVKADPFEGAREAPDYLGRAPFAPAWVQGRDGRGTTKGQLRASNADSAGAFFFLPHK